MKSRGIKCIGVRLRVQTGLKRWYDRMGEDMHAKRWWHRESRGLARHLGAWGAYIPEGPPPMFAGDGGRGGLYQSWGHLFWGPGSDFIQLCH